MQHGSVSPIQLSIINARETQPVFDFKQCYGMGSIAPPLLTTSTSMAVILLFLTGCAGGGGSGGTVRVGGQTASGQDFDGQIVDETGPDDLVETDLSGDGLAGEEPAEDGQADDGQAEDGTADTGPVLPDQPPAIESPIIVLQEIDRQFTVNDSAEAANETQMVEYEESALNAITAVTLTPTDQAQRADDQVTVDKNFGNGALFAVNETADGRTLDWVTPPDFHDDSTQNEDKPNTYVVRLNLGSEHIQDTKLPKIGGRRRRQLQTAF